MDVFELADAWAASSEGVAGLKAFADGCDPALLDGLLRDLELEARQLEARRAVLLAAAERRRVFRADAHVSMWGMLRANLGWSDTDCKNRMRVARLCDRFPEALDTLAGGWG